MPGADRSRPTKREARSRNIHRERTFTLRTEPNHLSELDGPSDVTSPSRVEASGLSDTLATAFPPLKPHRRRAGVSAGLAPQTGSTSPDSLPARYRLGQHGDASR